MKKAIAALIGAVFSLFLVLPAHATENQPIQIQAECVEGWYVNPDEGQRIPEVTETGFLFGPSDLMHHATDLSLGDLDPGSFVSDIVPDQDSFFSVEVYDSVTHAYGTLRWDGTQWLIVIGAGGSATDGTFYDDNPVDLLAGKVTKWGAFSETTRVVSFGVGYTLNPPGSGGVTVSSVTFAGNTYDLTCKPEAEPTTPAPTTPATTEIPPSSEVPTLPVTGAPVTGVLVSGFVMIAAGVGALLYARRRREV